jgi:hypothetical protein
MTKSAVVVCSRRDPPQLEHQIFFIIFVDAIFTTLLERLFTNAFDVIDAKAVSGCVCRARHAD